MFSKLFDAIKMAHVDDAMLSMDEELRNIGVPYVSFSPFSKTTRKADGSKTVEMIELSKKCLDGVDELDAMIASLYRMRGSLVHNILSIRNSFPTFNPEATERLCRLAETKDDINMDTVRDAFAEFLGYESLPDSIVNVSLRSKEDYVMVYFGIKGKPTNAGVAIPVAVDYSKSFYMQQLDDENGLESFPKDKLERYLPYLNFGISVGVGKNDERSTDVKTIGDLKKAIEALFDYDVRSSIANIEDVSNATTAEQFDEWRMLRHANKCAMENKKDE